MSKAGNVVQGEIIITGMVRDMPETHIGDRESVNTNNIM